MLDWPRSRPAETLTNAAAHSATIVAQKGDAYNITSFIKEENTNVNVESQ